MNGSRRQRQNLTQSHLPGQVAVHRVYDLSVAAVHLAICDAQGERAALVVEDLQDIHERNPGYRTSRPLQLVGSINRRIDAGMPTVLHCKAGLGRTGTLLACVLVYRGVSAVAAIHEVRCVNPRYIQSDVQLEFIAQFAEGVQAEPARASTASETAGGGPGRTQGSTS
jgi:protein-tyrosine phosphatase